MKPITKYNFNNIYIKKVTDKNNFQINYAKKGIIKNNNGVTVLELYDGQNTNSFNEKIINLPYFIIKLASRSLPWAVHEIKNFLISNSISSISIFEIVLLD